MTIVSIESAIPSSRSTAMIGRPTMTSIHQWNHVQP